MAAAPPATATTAGSVPIVEFTADAYTIPAGGTTYLHWHVEGVTAAYLDGAPVTGPYGQKQVSPATTTTYTLSVLYWGGEIVRQVTITVQ